MRKRIFLNFTLGLCGIVAMLLGIWGAMIFPTIPPAFANTEPTEIAISVENLESSTFTRVRYFDNAIYLIDSTGRRVIKHNISTNSTADSIIYSTDSDSEDKKTEPYNIVSFDDKYLISTTTLYVNLVTQQGNKELNSYKSQSEPNGISISRPQTLASSASGETYLINDNILLYYNSEQLELYSTLSLDNTKLQFTAGGGFCVTEDNSAIYFSIGTQIYKMDTKTKEISSISITESDILTTITYLNTDNLGNLYIGCDNSLYKYNTVTNEITNATLSANTTSFDIDFVNGKVYYITKENKVFVTEISENFVTNYSKIAPKVQLTNISASATAINVVEIKQSTQFYQYQTLLSATNTYEIGKRLIVLYNDENSPFYYIFDNNCTTSSGFQLGFVLKSACEMVENEYPTEFSENKGAKVITGQTKIFVMPISQEIAQDTYISSLGTLSYGDTIAVQPSPILFVDSNGATFIAVKYTKDNITYIGYVDSRTVVSSVLTSAETKSVPNATTKAETIIYAEKNCFNKIDVLAKGCEVKIISTLNGVSKIEYYITEGEDTIVKTGYCKSDNLSNGALTTAQIAGLILMGVSVIIAIVVIIIGHKRKRKLALSQQNSVE